MKITNSFNLSTKHIQIDKTYAKMVLAIAAAASIVIFSLVVSGSLFNQLKYQNKVIGLRSTADAKLKTNVEAVNPLVAAYNTFDETPESVIGDATKNSKVILDSLPSKYDFPALASSLEYIVLQSGMGIKGISGTDNEVSAEQNSTEPKPIEMPFVLLTGGSFAQSKALISNFERSIRPFSIQEINISGTDGAINLTVNAKTYYQPGKKLEIKQVVVPGSNAKATKAVTKTTTGSTK